MSLFLLCHSPDAHVFITMDDIDRVHITWGTDTRECPWKIVSVALRKHGFVEPDEFDFRDEEEMYEYLAYTAEAFYDKEEAADAPTASAQSVG